MLKFICDACENEIPEDKVNTVSLSARTLGDKVVHLCDEDLDGFMDATLGGNDLFLQD
jgi:hypothetical protein